MKEILKLEENWKIISSENLDVFGKEISSDNYQPTNWLAVKCPTTVVNGLFQSGKIANPYFGTNLKKLSGFKHDIETQNYESHYKPTHSPYRSSWWFRTDFCINGNKTKKKEIKSTQYWIRVKGIHYRSNIWLNGERIAGSDYIIGTYRRYLINITKFIKLNEKNILAFEIFSSEPDELGISFVDWSPLPPDDDMGIWQPIYYCESGSVIIDNSHITSNLSPDLKEAKLNINLSVENVSDHHESITIEGKIEESNFSKSFELAPFEKQDLNINSKDFPQLVFHQPRIWWPYQLGTPELYELKIKCIVSTEEGRDIISDEKSIQFGIREFKSQINEFGTRIYTINKQDILIRGAGWTCDLMLQQSLKEDEKHIALLKNLNFNTVRLEGKFATDEFWDMCDQEGILVMAGWCCCSHWEKWDKWKAGDINIACESLKSQLLRLRNHASFMCWLYGSDFAPPKPIESEYLKILKELTPHLPILSSASHNPSDLCGETGVKMTGPYNYVPPIYWYDEGRIGEARGFNTETCPEVCIPPLESLKKMMSSEQLYLGSESWNFHAGLGAFRDTKLIEKTISERYGSFNNLPEFVELSQILGYEAWRAMYEAYARNFPEGSGVIGWMLNSPWPSLIWQLYDYYYNPNGAYYGSKMACEPIHIQYSYDDHSIWIINFTKNDISDYHARIRIYDINSKLIADKLIKKLALESYTKKPIQNLSDLVNIDQLPDQFFVDLNFENITKSEFNSKNFYWLPRTQDVLQEEDEWPYTPIIKPSDLSAIRNLPAATINKNIDIQKNVTLYEITVKLTNISENIAFFLWAKIKDNQTGEYITPVYWNNNCVTLVPSDSYILNAQVDLSHFVGIPIIEIKGFNTINLSHNESFSLK